VTSSFKMLPCVNSSLSSLKSFVTNNISHIFIIDIVYLDLNTFFCYSTYILGSKTLKFILLKTFKVYYQIEKNLLAK
jgi:hypothetical protein